MKYSISYTSRCKLCIQYHPLAIQASEVFFLKRLFNNMKKNRVYLQAREWEVKDLKMCIFIDKIHKSKNAEASMLGSKRSFIRGINPVWTQV